MHPYVYKQSAWLVCTTVVKSEPKLSASANHALDLLAVYSVYSTIHSAGPMKTYVDIRLVRKLLTTENKQGGVERRLHNRIGRVVLYYTLSDMLPF